MNDFRTEMLNMCKSSWESQVKALKLMQEQGQRMLELYISQTENVQSETKKLIEEGLVKAEELQKRYVKTIEDIIKQFDIKDEE